MESKKRSKSILFLLIILLVPLFLLFGCEEPATFRIDTQSNEIKNGTVYGYGTYKEGETVTLTAESRNGKLFIAWIYQNKTIITNNSTYNIQTSEDNLKSTLTFTASKGTADIYTAVFQDDTQRYYLLNSYKLTTDLSADEPLEDESTEILLNSSSLNVSVGATLTTMRDTFLVEGDFRDGRTVKVEGVTQVLNMSYDSPYYVRFALTQSNGEAEVKTTPVQFKENSVNDGVRVIFNGDNSFDVQYTFQITTLEDDEEVLKNITLVLNFSPMTIEVKEVPVLW